MKSQLIITRSTAWLAHRSLLQELGPLHDKELVRDWCEVHGVEFVDRTSEAGNGPGCRSGASASLQGEASRPARPKGYRLAGKPGVVPCCTSGPVTASVVASRSCPQEQSGKASEGRAWQTPQRFSKGNGATKKT